LNPRTVAILASSILLVANSITNPLGNYTVVSELLKCGYRSLEAKNQEGQTAVHLASRMGKDDILKKLIESGANVNCRDKAGYTPLHVCTTVCWQHWGVSFSSSHSPCCIILTYKLHTMESKAVAFLALLSITEYSSWEI
jgi:ankyrin repeat protein